MYLNRSKNLSLAATSLTALLAGPGWSQSVELEDLERQLQEQDERLESLEFRLEESDEESTFEEVFGAVDIHGYISQGYMRSNKNNFLAESYGGSFQFNELGINFSVELTDQLHAGLQLASRDLGSLGNNKVVVDWAFMDYHYQDWMGLRVGRVKMPFGLYNETRDIDMLRTSILLPQGVYNENFRDALTGIQGGDSTAPSRWTQPEISTIRRWSVRPTSQPTRARLARSRTPSGWWSRTCT